jgi:hypothetical protein
VCERERERESKSPIGSEREENKSLIGSENLPGTCKEQKGFGDIY